MLTDKKKRTLAGFLTALILWPALHFWLAKTVDINPWRFAGWAMYSVSRQREVRMALWRCDAGTPARCGEPIRVAELSEAQGMKLRRFSRERSAWGALRSIDDVANDVAPLLQGSPVLRISLAESRLDPSTNTIRETQADFDYQRSAGADSRLRRR